MKRLLILAVVLSFCLSSSAFAETSSYSADINVNVTAQNAASAREKAMQQANRQAILAIAANFTTRDGLAVLNKLTDEQLLNFIKETTVLEEKTSHISYMAKLRITAYDRLLRQYLQEKEVPLVVAASADVMVILLNREDTDTPPTLWGEQNLWQKAWERRPQMVGSIRITPLRQRNMPYLTASKVTAFDPMFFRRLKELNGGKDIFVAEAFPNEQRDLSITVTNVQTQSQETFNVKNPLASTDPEPKATEENTQATVLTPQNMVVPLPAELYERAVLETAMRIADELKGESLVTSTELQSIPVVYSYNGLKKWLRIEQEIGALTSVQSVRLNAIGNGRIQFQIDYIGEENTLIKGLADHRLILTKSDEDFILTEM